jgi:hypothetical protein
MPSDYSPEFVQRLLDSLWNMFTETQAQKLIVSVPWDTSEQPSQMRLADLATLLESWLG